MLREKRRQRAETALDRVIDRASEVSRRRVLSTTIIVLACIALVASAHVRVAMQSAGFFIEVFPDMPAYPLRWFTDEPLRFRVSFPHDGEEHEAYLYQPRSAGCHAGMVMYIGVGDEYGDPHLDRAARALARNGIAVLVPISEDLINHRLTTEESAVAVSAFRYLQDHSDVDRDRVGMFGISIGGSIVANAAQSDEIRDEVTLVHSLGGFYDAFDLLTAMSLSRYEVDGESMEWEPAEVTARVVRNSILPALPEEDHDTLSDLLFEPHGEVPDDLTPEGEALARLMLNDDPERVDDLIADLPAELIDLMRTISPSDGIENLRARSMLLHDRQDYVIHYGESVRFYDAVENAEARHLTLLDVFHHVRPDEDGGYLQMIGDGIRLYGHIYRLHRPFDDRGWLIGLDDLSPWMDGRTQCR